MTRISPSPPIPTILLISGTAVAASLATIVLQKLWQRQNQKAPKRCAGAIRLKPDKYDIYTQLHDYVWDEVLRRMYLSNIRNFTIYYHRETSTLFHHYDWIGGIDLDPVLSKDEYDKRYQHDMNLLATDPATREWWRYCEPCQEPFQQYPSNLKPPSQQSSLPQGDWWAPLECLNHCGYWPVLYSKQNRDPYFILKNPYKKRSTRMDPPNTNNNNNNTE